MELSSDHVGAHTKVLETEVTERLAMNYAAAIGDNNPLYFDDERDGGIIAPPMSSLALTWPLSGDFLNTWEADSFPHPFPYEVMQQQVHYTETLEWHTLMHPGQRLRIRGEMIAVLPHRAGTRLVVRYEANEPDGKPVFTEYIGALLRRVRCPDGGSGEENLPSVPECPEGGEPLWKDTIRIDPLAAHVYDGCTNMYFPIHTSVKFARSVGLKDTIFQGAATLSLAVREVVDREAGGDATRLTTVSCTFTGMVIPGSDIDVRFLHREDGPGEVDLFFDVVNSQGRRAISGGHARLHPSHLSKEE